MAELKILRVSTDDAIFEIPCLSFVIQHGALVVNGIGLNPTEAFGPGEWRSARIDRPAQPGDERKRTPVSSRPANSNQVHIHEMKLPDGHVIYKPRDTGPRSNNRPYAAAGGRS